MLSYKEKKRKHHMQSHDLDKMTQTEKKNKIKIAGITFSPSPFYCLTTSENPADLCVTTSENTTDLCVTTGENPADLCVTTSENPTDLCVRTSKNSAGTRILNCRDTLNPATREHTLTNSINVFHSVIAWLCEHTQD